MTPLDSRGAVSAPVSPRCRVVRPPDESLGVGGLGVKASLRRAPRGLDALRREAASPKRRTRRRPYDSGVEVGIRRRETVCPVAVYGCASSAWLGAVMEGMVEEANEAWWRRCDWPGISATAAVSVAEATLLHGRHGLQATGCTSSNRRTAYEFDPRRDRVLLAGSPGCLPLASGREGSLDRSGAHTPHARRLPHMSLHSAIPPSSELERGDRRTQCGNRGPGTQEGPTWEQGEQIGRSPPCHAR